MGESIGVSLRIIVPAKWKGEDESWPNVIGEIADTLCSWSGPDDDESAPGFVCISMMGDANYGLSGMDSDGYLDKLTKLRIPWEGQGDAKYEYEAEWMLYDGNPEGRVGVLPLPARPARRCAVATRHPTPGRRGRRRRRNGGALMAWHVLQPGDDPLVDWHRMYGDVADKQGWSLFECTGDDRPPIELEKVDDYWLFDSDADAWEYVVRRAQAGDLACATALHVLAVESPDEHAAIMDHVHGRWAA